MKYLQLSLLTLVLIFGSCSTVQNLAYVPSNLDKINAVKELMTGSAAGGISTLTNLSDNGIEALLPKEVRPVVATLKTLGLGKEIDQLNKKLGIASEAVLVESKGLMSDAIKEIKIENAADIILGGQDAATRVLKDAMYGAVTKRYSDRLDQELNKVDEMKYWDKAVSAYNLFADKKIKGSLSENIARAGVEAIFAAMAKQESRIRENPASLNKEVVTKVFDFYDNKN